MPSLPSSIDLPNFGDLYNTRFGGERRSREAFLFLHGFPAEQGNKNIDVAAALSETFASDAYIIHYAGLGRSRGSFTFEGSVSDAIAYARHLVTERSAAEPGYEKIHVIGHSWGAWVAMNVFASLAPAQGSLALLAPFTRIADGPGAGDLATYFLKEHQHIFPVDSWDRVREDLERVRQTRNPRDLARNMARWVQDILVVHAIHDDIIPIDMMRTFLECFPTAPEYIELDSDHRFFSNRHLLIEVLQRFFSGRVNS